MATYQITDPNTGVNLELTGDSPPTEEELEQIFAEHSKYSAPPVIETVSPESQFPGQQYLEPIATMASGIVAEPVAGIAGLAQSINPWAEQGAGAKTVKSVTDNLTYKPRLDESKANLQSVGEFIQPVAEPVFKAIDYVADKGYELTDSPAVGAGLKALPTAVAEYFGLKGFSKLRSGTRLLDPQGKPTRQLESLLDKDGLTYETLTPEAKQAITEFTEPKLLPSPKAEKGIVRSGVMKQQLSTGGRDNALAPFKLAGDKVIPDKMAKDAINQGWKDGTVQMVKVSNKNTKTTMNKMLNMRWALLKNDSLATKLYPLREVGNVFNKRIDFIRGEASKARIQLDRIAKTELPGMAIKTDKVEAAFYNAMDNLGINFGEKFDGVVNAGKLNFSTSDFKVNKSAQRTIRELVTLMDDSAPVDAARMHQLKKQLDDMIDWKKKGKDGLSEKARGVLKDLRSAANDSLREVVPGYADTNDKLSRILTVMDEFKTSFKIDRNMFIDSSDVIGNEMRKIHTKYKAGHLINQNITNVDQLANDLGGKFDANYEDLVQFSNRMDEVFGSSKSGDFRGITESAATFATEGIAGKVRSTKEAAKGLKDKVKGVNQFGQYQSMKDLLNRQN